MVNEVEGVTKVYVVEVYFIICESSIFQHGVDYLYLSRGVSMWSKSFSAIVWYFVFFTVTCNEGGEGTCVEFVDDVG